MSDTNELFKTMKETGASLMQLTYSDDNDQPMQGIILTNGKEMTTKIMALIENYKEKEDEVTP